MKHQLKELRLQKGLTQEEVAQKAEISRAYYTMIENSSPKKTPTVPVMMRIANVLGFEWQKFYMNK